MVPVLKNTTMSLVAAALLLVCEAAYAGEEVFVTDENLALLEGTWQGHGRAIGKRDGKTYWESDVTLAVENTTQGTFTLQNGRAWPTTIRAKDGKVLLTYGRAERAFTLEREDAGRYQLTIQYASTYQGWKRDNTLVLSKK